MVRNFIVPIALHAGMPAVAVRHGFSALNVLTKHQHVRLAIICVYTAYTVVCLTLLPLSDPAR